jgi:hypothetical protein
MQARLDDSSLSPAQAAARLRHMEAVRARARAAALAPSFALIALGVVALSHGLLATAWPHARALTIVWVAAVVAVRPALRVLRRRVERGRGVESRRLPLTCAAGAVAVVAVAIAVGADPLVGAVAAATAVAAALAGMPAVALAAVAAGLAGDAVVATGAAAATGEVVAGAGLLAAGLVARARERA